MFIIILIILIICCICSLFPFAYLKGYLFGSPKLFRILHENATEARKLKLETGDSGEKWQQFICGDSDAIKFFTHKKYKTWLDTQEARLAILLQVGEQFIFNPFQGNDIPRSEECGRRLGELNRNTRS